MTQNVIPLRMQYLIKNIKAIYQQITEQIVILFLAKIERPQFDNIITTSVQKVIRNESFYFTSNNTADAHIIEASPLKPSECKIQYKTTL